MTILNYPQIIHITTMDDSFVGQLMTTPVRTASPYESAAAVAQRFCDHDINSLIIVDDDYRLQGIVTTTDIVELVADEQSPDEPIRDYMTTDVVSVAADVPVREAADILVDNDIHHLPVVDETDMVLGVISTTDLTAYVSHTPPSP